MSTAVAPRTEDIARVLIRGDVSKLTPEGKLKYIALLCEKTGLDPLFMPFQLLTLQGREVVYATKAATEQLRSIHGISVVEITSVVLEETLIVTCKVQDRTGRTDVATGAVPLAANMKGEVRSNAIMKCETKAKRRATLSIAGLGILDESETDSIPGAVRVPLPAIDVAPAQPALPEAASGGAVPRVFKQARILGMAARTHPDKPISWADVTFAVPNMETGEEDQITLPTASDVKEAAISVFEQIPPTETVTIYTDVGPRNGKERICRVERVNREQKTAATTDPVFEATVSDVGF